MYVCVRVNLNTRMYKFTLKMFSGHTDNYLINDEMRKKVAGVFLIYGEVSRTVLRIRQ